MPPARVTKSGGKQQSLKDGWGTIKTSKEEGVKRKEEQLRIDDQIPAKKKRVNDSDIVLVGDKTQRPEAVEKKEGRVTTRISPSDEREIEPGRMMRRDEVEAELKSFDLNSKYGPCMSRTRKQRWERAKKLNLDPPDSILLMMNTFPEMDRSIWHGRVTEDLPWDG